LALAAAERAPAGAGEDGCDLEAQVAVGVDRVEPRWGQMGDHRVADLVSGGPASLDGVLARDEDSCRILSVTSPVGSAKLKVFQGEPTALWPIVLGMAVGS
jgi:hypothetical protein